MIYGFLTFTGVTTISEFSWSLPGRLSMPSGVSTTSLDPGLTVFIKGMNQSGDSSYHKFKVNKTTYSRGKLTVYVDYDDNLDDIYAPSTDYPYAVITSKGTDEGFYFLPTTDLNNSIPQADLDYIRNLDLQERDYNYDLKMQQINEAQNTFITINKADISSLKEEDINIYRTIGYIADQGYLFDEEESDGESESE